MLCLVRLKGCKRCGGDVSLECDVYGVYAECIQCGATWTRKDLLPADGTDTAVNPGAGQADTIEYIGNQR